MKKKFIRVAERSTDGATAALKAGVQEKAAFLAYHAFESSGAALGDHIGLDMGMAASHPTKLKRFLHAAKKVGIEKQIASLTVKLAPMRNRFLYPDSLPDGTIVLPEDQITTVDADKLLRQVKGIVRLVKGQL